MDALGTAIESFLTPARAAAAAAFAAGAVMVFRGLIDLYRSAGRPDPTAGPGDTRRGVLIALFLLLVLAAGLWLRLHGIEARTLTHTEGMLPNLPWPPDAWPPARHSLYDAFWWHFHSELHPPAHYLLMWAWIEAFGTSLTSLRLPSALFGLGAVAVAYRIGALVQNRETGLIAATLMAFNGFQVFNSQYARVYMMGVFLALLSTLALLELLRSGGPHRRWEATYLLSACLAVYTKSFFWLVLAIQLLWVGVQLVPSDRSVRRVLVLQSAVIMIGAAALAHQLYHTIPTAYPSATPAFVVNYLLLGFALLPDGLSIPERRIPEAIHGAFALLAIGILAVGLRAWTPRAPARPPRRLVSTPPPATPNRDHALRWIAFGSSLVTLGFVLVALQRQFLMAWAVLVPVGALVLPAGAARVRSELLRRSGSNWVMASVGRLAHPGSLLVLLALIPATILFAVSPRHSVLNPRGLILFSSFLLIVAAGGAWVAGRGRKILAVALTVGLLVLHALSLTHWAGHPSESRDYRALSEKMNERMVPGDLLFAVPREHAITPLYYYLDGHGYRYVTRDYAAAVARQQVQRVWLVYFESYEWGPFRTTTEEMMDALSGFVLEESVDALRARAELYSRMPE